MSSSQFLPRSLSPLSLPRPLSTSVLRPPNVPITSALSTISRTPNFTLSNKLYSSYITSSNLFTSFNSPLLSFSLKSNISPLVRSSTFPLIRSASTKITPPKEPSSSQPQTQSHSNSDLPTQSNPNPNSNPDSEADTESHSSSESDPTQSAYVKFKNLTKKYGIWAIGMYFLLSGLEFPFTFLAVHLVGAERLQPIVDWATGIYHDFMGSSQSEIKDEEKSDVRDEDGNEGKGENGEKIKEEMKWFSSPTFWAEILLAYTIHKTVMLPVRAGLTVAWTPRVVEWLRARGWIRRVTNVTSPSTKS
ncbi:hypothetical protein M231_04215 [Tremella mesenterica]|uniref:DUF1279 domain-containing protein n=1 Tax=Tremella mesenterica TaxID=5217 RepID=A0A4Q1BL93_TREME|nr:hypothetical protein M231_04215 [Tremella mesenterica]